MESAALRNEKATKRYGSEKARLKEMMTNVICEEGFRKIEEMAVTALSGIESDEAERKLAMEEAHSLTLPLFSNLFAQKREIAEKIAAHEKYTV